MSAAQDKEQWISEQRRLWAKQQQLKLLKKKAEKRRHYARTRNHEEPLMRKLNDHIAAAINAINATATTQGTDPASRRQALLQIALHAQRRADELKAKTQEKKQ